MKSKLSGTSGYTHSQKTQATSHTNDSSHSEEQQNQVILS